ncbi:1-acyl-sn-glycerol-3-phosphate acyltransferase [Muribaculum gordoncarteri]|uniref:Glycerol acyltransferase n=1 Tax=Muribaculum gordoncarteri TaxID=2530390 RepID=A0A4P7VPD5_9BACT|nr:1-acyl-sn-glycerol-3-phosphate acyltransferase [Muribaculum gordoncarteri]QCD36371.1 glycerol acyltransferase [Muribaculum gordoncarteri]
MAKNDNLRVDISATLNSRASKYAKFIPGFMVKWLEHTICQDELNGILERTSGKRGAEFCHAVLDDLDIKYNVIGADNMPPNRRVVIVSNHPLGALDGIALIDWVSKIYGPGVKFIVNDLLMAVKPLDNVFLPINKHGKQSRKSSSNIEEVFAGNDPIIIFPAGLVSRKRDEGIRDLKWQKMFINKAVQYHRDIIPVYFDGKDSPFFYNFAKLRTRVGLKFNIEMIYLPREIFRSRHARFTIVAGKPIPYNRFKGGRNAAIEAKAMKRIVYDLKSKIQ